MCWYIYTYTLHQTPTRKSPLPTNCFHLYRLCFLFTTTLPCQLNALHTRFKLEILGGSSQDDRNHGDRKSPKLGLWDPLQMA